MGQRLILSEEEKRNIQEMYGLINEQNTEPRGIYFGGEYFGKNWKSHLPEVPFMKFPIYTLYSIKCL